MFIDRAPCTKVHKREQKDRTKTLAEFPNRVLKDYGRNQPDDSVPLCKYCIHQHNKFLKEMNNDNELKFALRDQIVGLATPLHIAAFSVIFPSYNHGILLI